MCVAYSKLVALPWPAWQMVQPNFSAEWALFAAGLDLLRDFIEEDIRAETDDAETGIPVFDRLTPEQKLALLAETARALRDPTTPTPHHTAANEGGIVRVMAPSLRSG